MHHGRASHAWLGAMVALLGASRGSAAEPGAGASAEPLEVTVEGEPNAPDTGASGRAVTHVSAERILDVTAGSLADALRGHTGVSVQQTSPGQGTVYVRGLSSREVLHLVDGVPLDATIFRAGNNPYLGLVDPYALHTVDVVRGAASVVHGSDALGGVVALATRLPDYSLVEGGVTSARAYQAFTVAPFGSTSRVALEHGAERWAVHVGLSYFQSGDIRPGGGLPSPVEGAFIGLERAPGGAYLPELSGTEQGTAFQTYAGDASFRARLAPGTELVLRAQLALRPELRRYDELVPLFKSARPARAESSLEPLYRTMTSATLRHRATLASSAYRGASVLVGWQRLHEHIRRRSLSELCVVDGSTVAADACPGLLRLVPRDTRDLESNGSDAASVRAETELGGRAWKLRAGADATHDRVTSDAATLALDTGIETPAPERFPTGSSQTQAGLFATAEIEPVRGLVLHAGLRGALFHLDIRERSVGDPGSSPPFARTVLDVALETGARLELAPGLSLVANAGRGVRAPNVQDFSGLGARAKGRFQLPNPDVRPEHTLSLDAGLRVAVGRTRAEAYLFHLRYLDAVALAPTTLDGARHSAAGERYEHSVNAARVDYVGLESALDAALAPPVGVEARLLAMIGTQYNDPRLELPAVTPADRVPPVSGSLALWVEPARELRLELGAHARLPQRRLNDPVNLEDNRIPAGGTPGFVSLRAAGRYDPVAGLTVRLALDNLTDAVILEHGSGFYRPGLNGSASVAASY
ncbi:MAG: TonB-dependent receptor [Polyangiaceae bacterium]|nr:TonB-dependent receptor [Polyangiaceae bacterium]